VCVCLCANNALYVPFLRDIMVLMSVVCVNLGQGNVSVEVGIYIMKFILD
jgi:hypothetical protein